MPCYSDYSCLSYEEVRRREQLINAKEDVSNAEIGIENLKRQINDQNKNINILNKCIEGYRKELDKVTSFLCETLNCLEQYNGLIKLSEENKKWWINHKKFDEDRLKNV